MSIDLYPDDLSVDVELFSPWEDYYNAAVLYTELLAVKHEITWWNAECNIRDLPRMFTDEELREWCDSLGLEPIIDMPPVHDQPGYPPPKDRLKYQNVSVKPRGHSHEYEDGEVMIYGGDPNCRHVWIAYKWSGWECNDCTGWYCA